MPRRRKHNRKGVKTGRKTAKYPWGPSASQLEHPASKAEERENDEHIASMKVYLRVIRDGNVRGSRRA